MVLLQLQLINATKSSSSSSSSEEDYDEGLNDSSKLSEPESGSSETVNVFTDHWKNCTFNGKMYFDDECTEWMRNFFIILSVCVIGMITFVFFFVYCCKKFCCSSNENGDFQRLVEER